MHVRPRESWFRPAGGVWAAGQAMVEFSLVSVLLLGMLVAIFEGGRLASGYYAVGDAAKEGARQGIYTPSATLTTATIDTSIRSAAKARLEPWISIPDNNITICRRSAPGAACGSTPIQSGSVLEVTVTYPFQFAPFAGGFLNNVGTITLTGFHSALID